MFPYSFLQRVHLRGVVSLFQLGLYFVAQRVYKHTVTHAVHGFRLLLLLFLFRIGRTWLATIIHEMAASSSIAIVDCFLIQ